MRLPEALVHARYYGVVLERLRAELGQLDGRPGPGGGGSGGRAAGADHPLLWGVRRRLQGCDVVLVDGAPLSTGEVGEWDVTVV
jgi:hypothetical protein